MNWTLPTPLLLFAGDVALWPLASAVRRPVSLHGLVAEVFAATLAIIALVWLGWIMLWLIEQCW
jgi:hypothetical protein